MNFKWRRRRPGMKRQQARGPRPFVEATPPPSGPAVVVERLDDGPEGRAIVADLSDRYEVGALDDAGRRFLVVVDDAFEGDEAVVRLAAQLDEIHRDWQRRLAWPVLADRLRRRERPTCRRSNLYIAASKLCRIRADGTERGNQKGPGRPRGANRTSGP